MELGFNRNIKGNDMESAGVENLMDLFSIRPWQMPLLLRAEYRGAFCSRERSKGFILRLKRSNSGTIRGYAERLSSFGEGKNLKCTEGKEGFLRDLGRTSVDTRSVDLGKSDTVVGWFSFVYS